MVRPCHYCKTRPGTTRDHIIAKSWGGRGKANLVPACGPCNNDKGNLPPTCSCLTCVRAVTRWIRQQRPLIAAMDPTSPLYRVKAERVAMVEVTYLGMAYTSGGTPVSVP